MEIEEIIGEWECVIIQWKRRESEMRHRWEWVIDWLNKGTIIKKEREKMKHKRDTNDEKKKIIGCNEKS